MNITLRGKREKDLKDPAHTVMFFDSVPGNNLAGGPELLPLKPRHKKYNIVFADGHRASYSLNDIRKLMTWRSYSIAGDGTGFRKANPGQRPVLQTTATPHNGS
jgi:prepilin-type processing-associated H-X9-DG protein